MSSANAHVKERRRGMPVAVYVLGLSLFSISSSEFPIAGVLPQISGDLQVLLPKAGTQSSAFAISVVVGA